MLATCTNDLERARVMTKYHIGWPPDTIALQPWHPATWAHAYPFDHEGFVPPHDLTPDRWERTRAKNESWRWDEERVGGPPKRHPWRGVLPN